jgi:hypothetical protein
MQVVAAVVLILEQMGRAVMVVLVAAVVEQEVQAALVVEVR